MKRALGTLANVDLGQWVKELPDPERTKGVPARKGQALKGRLESVHHFRVDGINYTACIVWISRTELQVRNREPDHREIRGLAEQEVEVTKNG